MRTPPLRLAVPGILLLLLGNCGGPPPALRAPVFIGIEPMENRAAQSRLLANLAAVSGLPVVDLADARNAWAFEALSATKLRLSAQVESGWFCLTSYYTVWADGAFQYNSGLVIPRAETDGRAETCIALFASRLRGDLLRQGQ